MPEKVSVSEYFNSFSFNETLITVKMQILKNKQLETSGKNSKKLNVKYYKEIIKLFCEVFKKTIL